MGILSELKKVLFGAESIGKSAINKGKDLAEEAGEELLQKTSEIASDIGNKTSGLRDSILEKAQDGIESITDNEALKNITQKTEGIGKNILETGENLVDKGKETVEQIGKSILGENNENLEKAKEFTEGIGAKVLDAKDKIVQKAEDTLDDINAKIDQTLEKAKAEEAAEAATPQKKLNEILEENEGSLMDGKDDFFAKAEKFAQGNYDDSLDGKISVDQSNIVPPEPTKAAGFDDLDGDGNEIVDDAIIDETDD